MNNVSVLFLTRSGQVERRILPGGDMLDLMVIAENAFKYLYTTPLGVMIYEEVSGNAAR